MSTDKCQVVLRDLQGLLQQSIDKGVEVVDYKSSMLLPPGENYGSTMLKVDAVVKKTKNSQEEEMHFVAKMIPYFEYSRKMLNLTVSITKESFIIDTLAHWYRQMEREVGIKEEDLIDIFPKFYGQRLSNAEKSNGEADDDAVMLLENLKVRGYKNMDRFNGMDFEHMSLGIKEYARFHALGTALRMKKPDLWKKAREIVNMVAFDPHANDFAAVIEQTSDLLCADPRMSKYCDRIRKAMVKSNGFDAILIPEEVEPWITILHGDSWVNNLLYHHDETGKVDDLKMVDYQIARVCSPMKELPYFLCSCGNVDVVENHFDELLDIYHDRYIEVLKTLGCDTSPFTKEAMLIQLNKDADNELFHCIVVLKIITTEVSSTSDLSNVESSVFMAEANEKFLNRSYKTIQKFIEKGWM